MGLGVGSASSSRLWQVVSEQQVDVMPVGLGLEAHAVVCQLSGCWGFTRLPESDCNARGVVFNHFSNS